MSIWALRTKLSQAFHMPLLAGRHRELRFDEAQTKHLKGFGNAAEPLDFDLNKIVFLHIPKTAGGSVNAILEGICIDLGKNFIKLPIRGPQSTIMMTDGWLGADYTVKRTSEEILENSHVISGHFPFQKSNVFIRDRKYIAVVRDPIEREISSFNYLYQTGAVEKEDNFKDLALQFLDNPQVRMIAGVEHMTGTCDESALEAAIENIENFFLLCAPVTQVDEMLRMLIGIYNWPSVSYHKSNVTRKKLISFIDDELRESLEDMHKYDRKLFNYIEKKWSRRVEIFLNENRAEAGSKELLMLGRDFRHDKKVTRTTLTEF